VSFEKSIAMVSSAAIGSVLLGCGIYQKHKVRESQQWPQSSGTITKAEVVYDTGPDPQGYCVNLTYDYVANDARHTGSRIGFRKQWYLRKKRAEEELARYPVNSSMRVYYNPANPAEAVLARESADGAMMIVMGIVLLVLAVVGSLFG
jgi:Protein of unknown function (DUF3592)